MASSIYHFFKFLVEKKDELKTIDNIEDVDFGDSFVSSRTRGLFPDLVIKINTEDDLFEGGELVEFKGSNNYSIASFNSTIPTGTKIISDITQSPSIRNQMIKAGNNLESLPCRAVYYLISGKHNDEQKIVLVHGSFFETIPVKKLICDAFSQIMKEADPNISVDKLKELSELSIEQNLFSQVRNIDGSSVKIRFRIMTEAESKANLLNSEQYPQIKPNTINLCIPFDSDDAKERIIERFRRIFNYQEFVQFDLKHMVDGSQYVVFQASI